jgi:hypothetical protein
MAAGRLPHAIVSLSPFRAAGLVPYIGHDDRYNLKFEGSAPRKDRHGNLAPLMGDGMRLAGKKIGKL